MRRFLQLENVFKATVGKAALMIAGTTIGAGMLGIPLVTGEMGFLAGAGITLLVWFYMYLTGIALVEVSLSLKDRGGFLGMAEKYLPSYGKTLVTSLFVFLYGILMIAYISAGCEIASIGFSGAWYAKFPFLIYLSVLMLLPSKRLIAIISALTFPMWMFFVQFLYYGAGQVDLERLSYGVYSKAYLAVPLLFGAFGYHNVIPSVTKYLNYDKAKAKTAILLGSCIPCLMYLVWQGLILGLVQPETLAAAKEKGVPIVALLGNAVKGGWIEMPGTLFAFFAIFTSALGVGLSVVQFIDKKERIATKGLVILVPALIAFTKPGIFLNALSIAGGFGESILNGIIPVWLYCIYKKQKGELTNKKRFYAFSLLIIATFVVFIELYNLV